MKKICVIVATDMTIKAFLTGHIKVLVQHYHVSVVANTDNKSVLRQYGIDIDIFSAPIERKISLFKDLWAIYILYRFFKQHRFDVVHSVSPKAGLLTMIAGFLAKIPHRFHTFTGQVWATRTGLSRKILKSVDVVMSQLSTWILIDSHSQRHFLLSENVVSEQKSQVLAYGSISGVDINRFVPDAGIRQRIRNKAGIPANAVVFLFVGRYKKDKGILDLVNAFKLVAEKSSLVFLLIVGPDEDDMKSEIQEICASCIDRVCLIEYSNHPEYYMAASEIFCLPSYREGFGSVVIEAAATGIPAIGSRIYGVEDAIDEGETGLLHDAGDVGGIMDQMYRLLDDPLLREHMGRQARIRAKKLFSKESVESALLEFYRENVGFS